MSNLADLLQQEIAEPTPPEDDETDQPDAEASAGEGSDEEEREGDDGGAAADEAADEEDTQRATPGDEPTSTAGAVPLHGTETGTSVLLPEREQLPSEQSVYLP